MNIKVLVFRFLICAGIFVDVAYGISLLANIPPSLTGCYGAIISAALCVSLVLALWNYNKKIIALFVVFSVLYILAALTKLFANVTFSGKEIAGDFVLGNLMCCLLCLFLHVRENVKLSIVKKTLNLFLSIIVLISLFIPFIFIGYCILSHRVLSTTILLTLFQTNFSEVVGYLKDQDFLLWGIVFSITLYFLGKIIFFIYKINDNSNALFSKCTVSGMVTVVFFLFCYSFQNFSDCYLLSVFRQARVVLNEYRDYGNAKAFRLNHLNNLKGLEIMPGRGGLYILVIGESETRDHMSVYGYSKDTTPWLTSLSDKNEKTGLVLFQNAYSNHTHTVPALTYALSVKNQYNTVPLKNAYSIMEVAKAAGYTTYWISNQIKYGVWDTPVAEIACTADHEIWLNGNVGISLATQYYDEKIVEELSNLKIREDANVFIVCHLMGSHGYYHDRYPAEFNRFKCKQERTGYNEIVATYDNTVYYTDYLLKNIFKFASSQPSFKGMVYLSDHGEDPDNGIMHEASKFTWQMARIPMFMFFSDSFVNEENNMFVAIVKNKNKFWTNDLLYNLLVNIMHIKNSPFNEPKWNLASEEYNMERSDLKTLHGGKNLKEEK